MKNTNNTELTLKFTNQEARDYFPLLLQEVATDRLEFIKSLPPAEADKECDMFPEPINGWLKVEDRLPDIEKILSERDRKE